MIVHQIPVGPMQNFSYIVVDEDSSESIIIDPSWNLMELELIIKENTLKNYDGAFICNSITGIRFIKKIDKYNFKYFDKIKTLFNEFIYE